MASRFHKLYATDFTLREEGAWVDLYPAEGDNPAVRVKLRAFDSKKSKELRRKLEAPYGNRRIPEEKAEHITNQQIAGAIIADWEGIQDEAGNEMPYSPETAYQTITKYPEFRLDVLNAAGGADLFREQVEADAAKN